MARSDGGEQNKAKPPRTPASTFNRRTMILGGAAAVGATVVAVRVADSTGSPDTVPTNKGGLASTLESVSLPTGDFDATNGISPFTTPTSDHYVIDTAFRKTEIDSATYTLTIGGPFVDTPLTLTYDDLLARQQITRSLALVGVSNPVGGDLVGNAVWTGVSLTDLLDEAGIDDPTNPERQIFSTSVDGYTAGFRAPLAYDGRTALVALAMNGEPLPVMHGFPARMIVNGLYGYTSSTKWLERIDVNDFATNDGFWIPRGWAKEAPVKTQSRIDYPSQGAPLSAGTHTIAGVAWAPSRGIAKVEVGLTSAERQEDIEWFEAELGEVESVDTWVQWRYDWDAPQGDWLLQVRATDGDGDIQSEEMVQPAPNGAEGLDMTFIRTT